ncbi:MAG: ABC transporter permease [Phycisphaeraceae bacterium]
MLSVVLKRILWSIPTLFLVSVISFVIIQLPPGDYLTSMLVAMEEAGGEANMAQINALRQRYGLDDPLHWQYLRWMGGLLRGDMGQSFEWNRPVWSLIRERLALTLAISVVALLFTWVIAIPIGIYSAARQYSWADHTFTLLGYVGLAVPNFLLALICMYVGYAWFGTSPGGLFSPAYQGAPWSAGKVIDLLNHLWVPVIVIGTAGTASLIRIMRANLMDELCKQYVVTARAKGLKRWKLLVKYPVRVALIPLVSTVGWLLPTLVSGEIIVSVVLGLPTTGPLLLQSLMNQDMYLAGSMVMMLSVLTVVGTLVSDLLLMCLDPRIRYER